MFVDIKDVKGNKRKDTIIFACKPVDWASINYFDPEQAEEVDIYFRFPVSHENLTVGDLECGGGFNVGRTFDRVTKVGKMYIGSNPIRKADTEEFIYPIISFD